MNKLEFDELVAATKDRRPLWFQLEREDAGTIQQIRSVETAIGASLPTQYSDFVTTYGAGAFAFVTVLGVQRGTGWALVDHRTGLPNNFVPTVDLETGDYYGHVVVDGRCRDEVCFWDHETATTQATRYADFYELVAHIGLKRG